MDANNNRNALHPSQFEETKGRSRAPLVPEYRLPLPTPDTPEDSLISSSIYSELQLQSELGSNNSVNPSKSDFKTQNLPGYCVSALPGLRAVTAPARPRTDLQKFKSSAAFAILESAAIHAGQLIQREDGKFDLESTEGQKQCWKFLIQVEGMIEGLNVQVGSRSYRNKFTKAYKMLYKDGSLCYLTEVLDAAQEGIFLKIYLLKI